MLDATHEPSSPCPDEAVLAAYIDGQLAAGARRDVEAHLAACDDCCEISVETIRPIQEGRTRTRPLFTSGTIATIGGLLALAASLIFWMLW